MRIIDYYLTAIDVVYHNAMDLCLPVDAMYLDRKQRDVFKHMQIMSFAIQHPQGTFYEYLDYIYFAKYRDYMHTWYNCAGEDLVKEEYIRTVRLLTKGLGVGDSWDGGLYELDALIDDRPNTYLSCDYSDDVSSSASIVPLVSVESV